MNYLLLFKKYGWILSIVLLVYGAWVTFFKKPQVDTTVIAKYESEITSLKTTISTQDNMLISKTETIKTLSMSVKSDEERIDYFDTKWDPPRLLKTITRKRTTTNTSSTDTSTSSTTAVSHGSTTIVSSETAHISSSTATTNYVLSKWCTAGGYLLNDRTLVLQQGYNLSQDLSVGVMGTYSMDNKSTNYGGFAIIRWGH